MQCSSVLELRAVSQQEIYRLGRPEFGSHVENVSALALNGRQVRKMVEHQGEGSLAGDGWIRPMVEKELQYVDEDLQQGEQFGIAACEYILCHTINLVPVCLEDGLEVSRQFGVGAAACEDVCRCEPRGGGLSRAYLVFSLDVLRDIGAFATHYELQRLTSGVISLEDSGMDPGALPLHQVPYSFDLESVRSLFQAKLPVGMRRMGVLNIVADFRQVSSGTGQVKGK
ncbi:hypothetical protein PG993_003210 [Apiospora rasikravindrae]|uniref:Uncharacterized protein n=1 Tax=Apiospora rasikravindrae TaxID=990691 RepID=A0ABR1TYS0_9PEZI